MMELSKVELEEIEKIKQRIKIQEEILKKLKETPEYKLQGNLFATWVSLGNIGCPKQAPDYGYYWCPKHNRWEQLKFECGLTIEGAVELLIEEIPRHASEVIAPIHKQIENTVKQKFALFGFKNNGCCWKCINFSYVFEKCKLEECNFKRNEEK